MITAADLKPTAIECWINVYIDGYSINWSKREYAVLAANNTVKLGRKLLYRIHVRLK
jgi:hypothetical protein